MTVPAAVTAAVERELVRGDRAVVVLVEPREQLLVRRRILGERELAVLVGVETVEHVPAHLLIALERVGLELRLAHRLGAAGRRREALRRGLVELGMRHATVAIEIVLGAEPRMTLAMAAAPERGMLHRIG